MYTAKIRGTRFPSTISFGLVTTATSLCAGTAMMTALQMCMALSISSGPSLAGGILTALFFAIPLVIGMLMLRLAMTDRWGRAARVKLVILGFAGLAFWAGLLAGPVLTIITASLPQKVLGRGITARMHGT
jgi:hypothetical protein